MKEWLEKLSTMGVYCMRKERKGAERETRWLLRVMEKDCRRPRLHGMVNAYHMSKDAQTKSTTTDRKTEHKCPQFCEYC
jgi:hypothetical protein